jgi:hypothetical protein
MSGIDGVHCAMFGSSVQRIGLCCGRCVAPSKAIRPSVSDDEDGDAGVVKRCRHMQRHRIAAVGRVRHQSGLHFRRRRLLFACPSPRAHRLHRSRVRHGDDCVRTGGSVSDWELMMERIRMGFGRITDPTTCRQTNYVWYDPSTTQGVCEVRPRASGPFSPLFHSHDFDIRAVRFRRLQGYFGCFTSQGNVIPANSISQGQCTSNGGQWQTVYTWSPVCTSLTILIHRFTIGNRTS